MIVAIVFDETSHQKSGQVIAAAILVDVGAALGDCA